RRPESRRWASGRRRARGTSTPPRPSATGRASWRIRDASRRLLPAYAYRPLLLSINIFWCDRRRDLHVSAVEQLVHPGGSHDSPAADARKNPNQLALDLAGLHDPYACRRTFDDVHG